MAVVAVPPIAAVLVGVVIIVVATATTRNVDAGVVVAQVHTANSGKIAWYTRFLPLMLTHANVWTPTRDLVTGGVARVASIHLKRVLREHCIRRVRLVRRRRLIGACHVHQQE